MRIGAFVIGTAGVSLPQSDEEQDFVFIYCNGFFISMKKLYFIYSVLHQMFCSDMRATDAEPWLRHVQHNSYTASHCLGHYRG